MGKRRHDKIEMTRKRRKNFTAFPGSTRYDSWLSFRVAGCVGRPTYPCAFGHGIIADQPWGEMSTRMTLSASIAHFCAAVRTESTQEDPPDRTVGNASTQPTAMIPAIP